MSFLDVGGPGGPAVHLGDKQSRLLLVTSARVLDSRKVLFDCQIRHTLDKIDAQMLLWVTVILSYSTNRMFKGNSSHGREANVYCLLCY